jgi:hypothetical protein
MVVRATSIALPGYHCHEIVIHAHILLRWMALLVIRLLENDSRQ